MVALTIPQAVKSEEQILIAAEPLLVLAVKLIREPLMAAATLLELELLVRM